MNRVCGMVTRVFDPPQRCSHAGPRTKTHEISSCLPACRGPASGMRRTCHDGSDRFEAWGAFDQSREAVLRAIGGTEGGAMKRWNQWQAMGGNGRPLRGIAIDDERNKLALARESPLVPPSRADESATRVGCRGIGGSPGRPRVCCKSAKPGRLEPGRSVARLCWRRGRNCAAGTEHVVVGQRRHSPSFRLDLPGGERGR